MGAWQLGVDAGNRQSGRLTGDATPNPLLTAIGRVLKFIPADIVVLFGGAVALYVTRGSEASRWLIPFFAALAAVFVMAGAYAAAAKDKAWWTNRVAFRTVIAIPATLLWSFTIPETPWNEFEWVEAHDIEAVVVAAAIAVPFSLFAEAFERRMRAPDDPAWPGRPPDGSN